MIQGSKLSGILYLLFTVAQADERHKLDGEEPKLRAEKYFKIDQEESDVNHYINRFFEVLKFYYNFNKFKINPDKTREIQQ